jgi:hypothetical protein
MKILKIIFSVAIALVAGLFGIVANSSDFGPEGPTFESFFIVFLFYMFMSFIFGLAFKYWKIAILISWGSVFTSLFMFFVAIGKKAEVSYVAFYFAGLVIVPLICLIFGYFGSKVGSSKQAA